MRKLILTALITVSSIPSLGANEWIEDFHVNSCNKEGRCLTLKAAKAQRSSLSHIYVFKNADISFRSKNNPATRQEASVLSKYGYLDLQQQTIVLTEVNDQSYNELVVSLKNHKAFRF